MDCCYIVFCPYFGKLPNHFDIWLESCKRNYKFKFIVFTDDSRSWRVPQNVTIKYITFDNFRKYIQKKFDFKISLNSPYKLCDYKPTYGYIFKDSITNYKYWGYCDLDVIFGNLIKFLPDEDYDKISYLGHLALYKNCEEVVYSFMNDKLNELSYKDILSSDMHFAFDEIGGYGVNCRFKDSGLTIYPLEVKAADICCYSNNLNLVKHIDDRFVVDRKKRIFTYENGSLYGITCEKNRMVKKEYVYLHFQKRVMRNEVKDKESGRYVILPHKIVDYQNIDSYYIASNQEKLLYLQSIKIRIKAGIHLIRRFLAIKQLRIKNML